MNYFVSMEPLNQAAKDFQKHPEVRNWSSIPIKWEWRCSIGLLGTLPLMDSTR